MPITVARDGGEVIAHTPLTKEQRERLWAMIVKNWAEANKETLRPDVDQSIKEEKQ